MLVDSHCHIDYPEFHQDFQQVLDRAKFAGLSRIQLISVKLENFSNILKIAENYENIYASVGIHPHYAKEYPYVNAGQIVELTKHSKVNSIGETGLDFYYNFSDKEQQIVCFIKHIEAARITSMPLIIHCRNAERELIEILEEQMKIGAFKFLIHCFSASKEVALKSIELGGYISISGIITFKNATDLQNIVKDLPLDRILIETDSPYLAPVPYRGKRNEPAYLKEIAIFLADLFSVEFEKFSTQTTENYYRLFS